MTLIARVWSDQVVSVVARAQHRFVGLHVQGAHREQRAGEPEQLVAFGVGGHPADRLQNRRVRIRRPQERHQREIEKRHGPHVDGRSARLRDPSRHAQPGIEHPVRVDLDHHLKPRPHHLRRNHGVGRRCQRSLVDLGRDRARPAGNLGNVREGAVQVKRGPDTG